MDIIKNMRKKEVLVKVGRKGQPSGLLAETECSTLHGKQYKKFSKN
jgi:hypothetical protein